MKHRLPSFLAGVCATLLVLSLSLTALAASGTVEFNTVGILFNGVLITRPGDSYTLDNGASAPSVITYTDEKGGGTTYLPARLLAELMEVEIGWDAASGSISVGSTPTPPQAPLPTPVPVAEEDVGIVVFITDHGAKYHNSGCRYLQDSRIGLTLADAKAGAYEPCSVCDPPR